MRSCAFPLALKGCAGLLLASLTLTVSAAKDGNYARAQAVTSMQQLAGATEQAYSGLVPALITALPAPARFEVEHGLGTLFTALGTYALADIHDSRAQAIALNHGNREAAVSAIVARAENALTVGDYARCEELAQLLVQMESDGGSERLRMYAEAYLGVIERRRGNLEVAAAHQHEALQLARTLDDDVAAGRALAHLGTIQRDRGDFAQALDMQLQALVLGEKTLDRVELTYRNLALLYRELGDDATSREYFQKALRAAERIGDPAHYATVYGSYSGFLNDQHDFENALRTASETLALDQALNNRPSIAFEQLEIGRALVGLKRLDEAVPSLEAALAAGKSINQHEIIARSLLALAEVALDRHDLAKARTLLEQALAGLDAKRLKTALAQAYVLREQLAAADGDTATALHYANEYTALREDLIGTAASRRLAALETRHARAEAEQKLVLANEENALQAARLEQQRLQRTFGMAAIAGLALLLALFAWRWLETRRLNRALQVRNQKIEQQRSELADANQRLERQATELYQAAITDPLTGVFNRGHLLRQLDARIQDCIFEGRELAVLLIDFDHFKQVNDARGHLFGDRVLVAGVQTLRQWLEPGDLIGRYGGEEFVAVIADSDPAEVRAMAERLRERVAEGLATFTPQLTSVVTVSIGIAMLSQMPRPVRLENLIEAADKAVYTAKANGRNRVMNYAA